jgi:hypothetical protein
MIPFIKKTKLPKIASNLPQEKLVSSNPSDHLEHHAVMELMEAVKNKDVKAFRDALEAILMNAFESEDQDATAAG